MDRQAAPEFVAAVGADVIATKPARKTLSRSLSFGSGSMPVAKEPSVGHAVSTEMGNTVRRSKSFTRGIKKPEPAPSPEDLESALPSLGAARLRSLDVSTKKNAIATSDLERYLNKMAEGPKGHTLSEPANSVQPQKSTLHRVVRPPEVATTSVRSAPARVAQPAPDAANAADGGAAAAPQPLKRPVILSKGNSSGGVASSNGNLNLRKRFTSDLTSASTADASSAHRIPLTAARTPSSVVCESATAANEATQEEVSQAPRPNSCAACSCALGTAPAASARDAAKDAAKDGGQAPTHRTAASTGAAPTAARSADARCPLAPIEVSSSAVAREARPPAAADVSVKAPRAGAVHDAPSAAGALHSAPAMDHPDDKATAVRGKEEVNGGGGLLRRLSFGNKSSRSKKGSKPAEEAAIPAADKVTGEGPPLRAAPRKPSNPEDGDMDDAVNNKVTCARSIVPFMPSRETPQATAI